MTGKSVRQLENVEFGNLADLDNIDIGKYRTCRGPASIEQIENIFELAMDLKADEDLRDNAIYDGLWDLLIHQYTLYSVTPIALYLLLKSTTLEQRSKIEDVQRFVEICARQGNEGIFLTTEEIEENEQGLLPIYSITDILSNHA
jgi:hypothetical protein